MEVPSSRPEETLQIVAVDLRGFGDSEEPKTGYNYQTWASDVGKVIEELKLQNVTLAGYSIGGAIAMYYASSHACPPVERLALIAAAGPRMVQSSGNPYGLNPEVFKRMTDLVDSLPGDDRLADSLTSQDVLEQFFEIVYPDVAVRRGTLSRFSKWLYNMSTSASRQALKGGLEEMQAQDLRENLSNIRVETRIFHGKWDKLVSPHLAEEQKKVLRARSLLGFGLAVTVFSLNWRKASLARDSISSCEFSLLRG